MTVDELHEVLEEIRRFMVRALAAMKAAKRSKHGLDDCWVERAAVRRVTMDLMRALLRLLMP